MIDYYLHNNCCFLCHPQRTECATLKKACARCRCSGCIWLDKDLHKCIFSVGFSREIKIGEFINRIIAVSSEQQNKLSDRSRRFVV
jgi:hypothetical protein